MNNEELEKVVDVVPEEKVKPAVKTVKPAGKSIEQLADEVERGIHGSGRERMIVLGDDYEAVQREVNLRAKGLK